VCGAKKEDEINFSYRASQSVREKKEKEEVNAVTGYPD
jgi:hypothetical protein